MIKIRILIIAISFLLISLTKAATDTTIIDTCTGDIDNDSISEKVRIVEFEEPLVTYRDSTNTKVRELLIFKVSYSSEIMRKAMLVVKTTPVELMYS